MFVGAYGQCQASGEQGYSLDEEFSRRVFAEILQRFSTEDFSLHVGYKAVYI
jgi:hypothetical protein